MERSLLDILRKKICGDLPKQNAPFATTAVYQRAWDGCANETPTPKVVTEPLGVEGFSGNDVVQVETS